MAKENFTMSKIKKKERKSLQAYKKVENNLCEEKNKLTKTQNLYMYIC